MSDHYRSFQNNCRIERREAQALGGDNREQSDKISENHSKTAEDSA